MYCLEDKRAIEGARQGSSRRKPVRSGGISRVTRVPHDVHLVSDLRDPVKPKIEVDTLTLIVELCEAEEVRSRAQRVLEPGDGLRGDEVARGNRRFRARQID